MKLSHIGSVVIIGLVSTVIGCGGEERPAGLPNLQPVKLKVVQGGTPLEGANVQLVAQDASNTWASGGTTDAGGEVKIMTMGKYEGAPVGKYKVTVDKIVCEGAAAAGNDPGSSVTSTAYRFVDTQFNLPDTTILEITVADGVPTEETMDVGGAVKEKVPDLLN